MLWDIAPLPRSRDEPSLAAVNMAAIDVMEACLALDRGACRESALHGLGENHWFVRARPRGHERHRRLPCAHGSLAAAARRLRQARPRRTGALAAHDDACCRRHSSGESPTDFLKA